MAGRRLVDVAKLFNASKSIARKHVNLRSQQLETFNQTSQLAKAVKNQTDRVTLTAKAAIALSRRLNEDIPAYASAAASRATGSRDGNIPRTDTVQKDTPKRDIREGLEQDHHYNRSEENAQAEPPAESDLGVQQEDAKHSPLPDGTIPSEGIVVDQKEINQDTFSRRPVSELPKQPLAKDHEDMKQTQDEIKPVAAKVSTIPIPEEESKQSNVDSRKLQQSYEKRIPSDADNVQQSTPSPQVQKLYEGHDRDVFYARSKESSTEPSSLPRSKIPKYTETKQESDDHVDVGRLNQDVYYGTPEPGQEELQREELPHEAAVPEQEQVPEGINTEVFRTARVAKMLGGNPYKSKPHLDLKAPGRTPIDHTKIAEGHDQDTFNVRRSEEPTPSKPEEPVQTKDSTSEKELRDFASQLASDVEQNTAASETQSPESIVDEPEKVAYQLRESRVPSSRFGRIWQYAGLGTSMALGAVGESLRRVTGAAAGAGGSLMLSPGNVEILVAKLSRMRGAALKLGQMISLQDIKMLPPEIHEVLQRVQDSADYMPASQRNKVLVSNLGGNWRDLFESFEDVPIAAASIGQVHKAVLKSNNQAVAVKVQYPGVARSIDSDLNNLSILLTASRLLPKGMYLDKTIANARTELGWETNYTREAKYQERFRELLSDDTVAFTVPKIFPEACGPEVLTAELMTGVGVTKLRTLTQDQRDWIGTQILRLCLREIVEFKLMQTDPNWTNFLYNASAHKIELLDFGASREYPDEFVGPYVNVLIAASKNDRNGIRDLSIQLGYLTGAESQIMLDAHTDSVLTLAEPFRAEGPEIYDFRDQTITDRVRDLVPVMLKERLSPPPEETYSLHRKLSGAFLLCARLGSRVPCRELFEKAVETYHRGGKVK